ncbi:BrxA family protein [Bdellovibrionota bacterium FG-1]
MNDEAASFHAGSEKTDIGAHGMEKDAQSTRHLGRDIDIYSARNSSKGALIVETRAVFHALANGRSLSQVRDACHSGKLLRQSARETRGRIWEAIHWRFFAWNPPAWVIADLCHASSSDATSSAFVGLVYLHNARRDRLTFDFVTNELYALRASNKSEVRRDRVIDFLANASDSPTTRWRESTRIKLAGNVLTALRDFGLLTGVQRKLLNRPVIPIEVALHLCRLLSAEGLRGRALLEARDWHLFFWEPHDISLALAQLAQRGDIRFERSGRTVMLDIPEHPQGATP